MIWLCLTSLSGLRGCFTWDVEEERPDHDCSPSPCPAKGCATVLTRQRAKAETTQRQQAQGGNQEQPRPRLRDRAPHTCRCPSPPLQSRRGYDIKKHHHFWGPWGGQHTTRSGTAKPQKYQDVLVLPKRHFRVKKRRGVLMGAEAPLSWRGRGSPLLTYVGVGRRAGERGGGSPSRVR